LYLGVDGVHPCIQGEGERYGLLLPAIGIPLSSIGNLSTLTVTFANQHFLIGGFLIAVITFIIVAFVIFLIVKIASHYKIQ
ncbi:MAG: MscL family protein, partial [Nitrososphaerota archaeon]|nr:MscL family protein [Nitrososphaerota archaeon]